MEDPVTAVLFTRPGLRPLIGVLGPQPLGRRVDEADDDIMIIQVGVAERERQLVHVVKSRLYRRVLDLMRFGAPDLRQLSPGPSGSLAVFLALLLPARHELLLISLRRQRVLSGPPGGSPR
jgi:hypothetical protein